MSSLLQDLRYAFRQLAKSPGFTVAAILTLAIGIGANTAIFSLMDAILLRPLAVPDMDRIMAIGEQSQSGSLEPVALANYEDWTRQNRSFEELAVRTGSDLTLTGAGEAAHVQAALTSASFFTVLRAAPALGRAFTESECQQGRNAVAVLNYGFWRQHFAGDPAVLGRHIELDQHAYTIIGVMPKSLQYPSSADLFVPLAPTPQEQNNRSLHNYFVIGRLRDQVTRTQAQVDMRVIADGLAKAYPATNSGRSVKVDPLLDQINSTLTKLYFHLVMGATLFVLLVVCANVANLQFARGIARRPEIAMRTALGASRGRIIRQLLTENVLLGVIGAAGGLLLAKTDLHLSLVAMPDRVARWLAGWSRISLNSHALAFSILLAVVTGVASGFAPALEATRLNLAEQLKSGSRATIGSSRAHWLRNAFAVAQISLAMALVIGAALMAKGMWSMLHSANAYEPQKSLTFTVAPPASRYDSPQKLSAFYSSSLERLRALPEVKRAEVTLALPYSDRGWLDDLSIENRPVVPGKFQSALHVVVSDGYFSALKIPLITGRIFNQGDQLGTVPVAVISRRFAARYFPGENPIGHRIRMGAERGSKEPWMTIVGIAGDVKYSWWDQTDPDTVYVNAAQIPPQNALFVVTTGGSPLAVAPAARKALAAIDPALPLDDVQTYAQLLHDSLVGLLYAAQSLGFDALVALLLAAIGIFAVMANQVAERTREIGVRLAMGARREDVRGIILRRALLLTASGIGAGLMLAFALAHVAANLLAGVRSDDPMVFGGITAAIAAIALGASSLPARRAANIDLITACGMSR